MTPLVDVVMVILIFLMLAGSFAGSTRYLMSKAGIHIQAPGPTTPDPSQPPDINIRISAGAFGFVAQSDAPRIGPTSSAADLRSQLNLLREKMVLGGTPADKLQIVLRPGPVVKYEDVLQVYSAALQAKYTKVAFGKSL